MDIKTINKFLEELSEDRTVPRNVRSAIQQSKNELNNEEHDIAVRISSAIATLGDVSDDPNIPVYARTRLLNVVSMLETLNREVKMKKS